MTVDHDSTEAAATTPGRGPGAWLLGAAVAAVTASVTLGLIAATGAPPEPEKARTPPSASPAAGPTPSPSATPREGAAAPELTPPVAEDIVTGFLDRLADTTANPEDGLGDLSELATGAILEELQNEQQELADNGWTRSGRDSIVSLEVTATNPTATPPTATVHACLDSKDVVLLDAEGEPIVSGMTPAQKRSINIYTLVLDGDAWRVASRTFPDEAAC